MVALATLLEALALAAFQIAHDVMALSSCGGMHGAKAVEVCSMRWWTASEK